MTVLVQIKEALERRHTEAQTHALPFFFFFFVFPLGRPISRQDRTLMGIIITCMSSRQTSSLSLISEPGTDWNATGGAPVHGRQWTTEMASSNHMLQWMLSQYQKYDFSMKTHSLMFMLSLRGFRGVPLKSGVHEGSVRPFLSPFP